MLQVLGRVTVEVVENVGRNTTLGVALLRSPRRISRHLGESEFKEPCEKEFEITSDRIASRSSLDLGDEISTVFWLFSTGEGRREQT